MVLKTKIKYFIVEISFRLIIYFGGILGKFPKVMSTEATIQYLLDNPGMSIARFGDGEFRWASGVANENSFQSSSDELRRELMDILKQPCKNLKLAIPNIFNRPWLIYTPNNCRAWATLLRRHIFIWLPLFLPRYEYLDANVTRLYIDRLNKEKSPEMFKLLKQLWEGKHVLIVEGESTMVGFKNDLLSNATSIRRIIIPSKNAFEKVDSIMDAIVNKALDDELILLSAGPTATVLASRLSKVGKTAYDLGHFDLEFEWMINHSLEREPVGGRFINELQDNSRYMTIFDTELSRQVIFHV